MEQLTKKQQSANRRRLATIKVTVQSNELEHAQDLIDMLGHVVGLFDVLNLQLMSGDKKDTGTTAADGSILIADEDFFFAMRDSFTDIDSSELNENEFINRIIALIDDNYKR